MALLLDLGNTRIKWRLLEEGRLLPGGEHEHRGDLSGLMLSRVWLELQPPTMVLGVTVASAALTKQLTGWCEQRWGVTPRFVTASGQACGVVNGYHEPARLGADRWVALIGAASLFKGACCVADCGTAVTIDCLDQDLNHLGGLILPGLSLMSKCVGENTARVGMEASMPVLLGHDTASCLASGAMHAVTATLQRVSDLVQEQLSIPVTRVITGGDAPRLAPWLDGRWVCEPELLFVGLSHLVTEMEG